MQFRTPFRRLSVLTQGLRLAALCAVLVSSTGCHLFWFPNMSDGVGRRPKVFDQSRDLDDIGDEDEDDEFLAFAGRIRNAMTGGGKSMLNENLFITDERSRQISRNLGR